MKRISSSNKQQIAFNLFLFLFCYSYLINSIHCDAIQEEFYGVVNDKKMTNFHTQHSTKSLIECCAQCLKGDNCMSANYNKNTGTCQESCEHISYHWNNSNTDINYKTAFINTNNDMNVPFTQMIESGMTIGKSIHVYGKIQLNAYPSGGFAINLLTSDGLDYALMMTSEWLSSTDINIKRSSWIANNLSTEEFDSEILDPLLTIDTPFVITVTCDVDKYLLYRNGEKFAEFDHILTNVTDVSKINIIDISSPMLTVSNICIA